MPARVDEFGHCSLCIILTITSKFASTSNDTGTGS